MNIQPLVQAIHTLNAYDAFRTRLTPEYWRLFGTYLVRRELKSGEVLIYQGDGDRAMYFIESGTLQVYVRGVATQHAKIALLRAGAIVGEPSMFGETVRMAQVDAISPCAVWGLTRQRLDELRAAQPDTAFEVLRAAGAVMAERMRGVLERGTPVA